MSQSFVRSAWLPWALGCAIVAVTVAAYLPALRAGFIWDDDSYVTENRHVEDPAGLRAIWLDPAASPQYYPLVFTTFWAEYRCWGLNPVGYHLVNVLLHAAGAVLLWRLLRRLAVPGAWLAAVIVAVHPMHVESVAWVTERKNVLAVVFYLLAALAYFHFDPPTPERGPRRWAFFPLALALFVCALLSKSITATLPGTLLAVLWWKRKRLSLADVAPLAALVLLGLAAGLHTAWLEVRHVGAAGESWSLSAIERVMLAGCVSWFYVGKLAWPTNLTFIYLRWTIEAGRWWLFIFPIAALAAVTGLWLARKRIGKGPLAAVLVYGITLFPAMGFFNVYPMRFSYVADHFAYPATIGLIALASAGAAVAFVQLRRVWPIGSAALAGMLGLAVATLAILSIRQQAIYLDIETLWNDTLAKNPSCWMAYNNRGVLYVSRGQRDRGLADYAQAISLNPRYAPAYSNRGAAYDDQGDYDRALADYTRAIDLDPHYATAYSNRGSTYTHKGRYDLALADCNKAIDLDGQDPQAYNNRGNAYFHKDDNERAIADYTQAIDLDPQYAKAYSNRGLAYDHKGDLGQALRDCDKALELAPDNAKACWNRGVVHADRGEYDLAIADLGRAIDLDPKNSSAYYRRGLAFTEKEEFGRAIADYTRAIDLDPSNAAYYPNRGLAYFARSDYAKAWADVNKCRALGGAVNPKFLDELRKATGRSE